MNRSKFVGVGGAFFVNGRAGTGGLHSEQV
jgi:hypothetical protein